MGQIDRSRRRRECAGILRHKSCTNSLDNGTLIDGCLTSPTLAVIPDDDCVTASSGPASRLSEHGRVVVKSAAVAITHRNEVDKENRTWQSAGKTTSKSARR